MRIFRPSGLIRRLFPGALFRLEPGNKQICLTFDDGPDPSSTPRILETLSEFGVKAVFFCNGDKAGHNPELMSSIRNLGHIIGNHGFLHADGWKKSCRDYIDNVRRADSFTSAEIFRPPYGHLTWCQYRKLKKNYRIIMWDLMPFDFDRSFGIGNCIRILRTRTRNGSIIVLHDTGSSFAKDLLREFLEFAGEEGYKFVLPANS